MRQISLERERSGSGCGNSRGSGFIPGASSNGAGHTSRRQGPRHPGRPAERFPIPGLADLGISQSPRKRASHQRACGNRHGKALFPGGDAPFPRGSFRNLFLRVEQGKRKIHLPPKRQLRPVHGRHLPTLPGRPSLCHIDHPGQRLHGACSRPHAPGTGERGNTGLDF